MKTDLMVRIDEALNRSGVDTRLTNQYCERIYEAVLTDNDSHLTSLQAEIRMHGTEVRAAVWSALSKQVRDKLYMVCPELL